MRVAFFDCISGISGDMALGALIDAGLDPDAIRDALANLPVESFSLTIEDVETHGLGATRVRVHTEASHVVRTYASIRELIDRAGLPAGAADLAQRIFLRLAEAEAVVHRRSVEQVTFHEVGAVDSIVDICGTAVGLSLLGVDRVYASAVPTGLGMITTQHGPMPIPAPAVVELLRGAPVYSRGVPFELVTPTGAAILATLVHEWGELPVMRVDAVGYGAGTLRADFPNLLRIMIGESVADDAGGPSPTSELVLETNVDDMNPELYPYVLERLFDAGAQDAWLVPIVMKKGRPSVTVRVLCGPDRLDEIRDVLFRETGTLGVRWSPVDKLALRRTWVDVATRHGPVRVKIGWLGDDVVTVSPEHEDCAATARASGTPLRDIHEEAMRLARAELRLPAEPSPE